MAKIETTFIRPKELYTPETGETKVVYDGYQNNPHELVVQENLEGDVSEIVDDTFVPNEGGNVVFTDGSDVEHELITKSGLGKAQVIETTWQALKDLRDNSQLIAGSLYRITDYNCTTTQENTQSAGHQFDIVLLALSENKLAEEGWAMEHPTDVYDVTFTDDVTKKCYVYIPPYSPEDTVGNIVILDTMLGREGISIDDLDEQNKTCSVGIDYDEDYYDGIQYNYFQNSNLSAWKVWYCLDNNKDRFAWADDSVDEGSPASIMANISPDTTYTRNLQNDTEYEDVQYYAWEDTENNAIYTTSETPQIGDSIYGEGKGGVIEDLQMTVSQFAPAQEGTGLPNGRGVIYRLIDEWNIDYPCDFKNIQILVPMDSNDNIDIQNPVRAKYCYAFTDNTSGDPEDLSIKGHAINIKVKPKLMGEVNSAMYFGPETLFYTNHNDLQICIFSNVTVGIAHITIFISRGYAINILDGSNYVILKDCGNICIGYNSSNIMLDTVVNSTFGSNCQNIQLVDDEGLNYGNNGVELATKE